MQSFQKRSHFAPFLGIFFTAGAASAGIMTYSPISGDADSGISPVLTYTAKADFFGTGPRSVNGVTFSDTGFSGAGYSLTGPASQLAGGANPNFVSGDVGGLVHDFYYGPADGNATLTLSGLTIGAEYVTTWYNRGWGAAGGRYVFITASDTPGSFYRVDQNSTGDGNGNVIRYTFTATDTTQTYAIDAVNNGDSFHHYAFTNAVRNEAIVPFSPAPVAPRISVLNSGGPQTPGVSNSDLLQTQLSGVTVTGTINPEGSGGVAALTNGSFTASLGGLGEFFTPTEGASVTFDLNVSTNVLGYDISSFRGYGGWQDSGRDQQNFSLYYSVVGNADFLFLGTVNFNPTATGNPTAISSIFDTALTGVDAFRVDFLGPVENGHVGYAEFDAIGVASVPEPASLLLFLGAAPLLLGRRRRLNS